MPQRPPTPPWPGGSPISRPRRRRSTRTRSPSPRRCSVYGAEAEAQFLPLWRSHINLVVDYTVGTASNDPAKAQQAVNKLLAYSGDLAGFFSGANPNLSKEAVADMVKEHIVTLKAVIDAQAKKDYAAEYTAQRTAYHHMGMMALALADGIAKQFPQKFY